MPELVLEERGGKGTGLAINWDSEAMADGRLPTRLS